MTSVDDLSADLLSEAVVVWTGPGDTAAPVLDDKRVVRRFGTAMAATLVPAIRGLYADFRNSDAALRVADLAEAGCEAAREFAVLHPEISEAAVNALAWCYTWDWR
jgi:hypothetical protein